MLKDFFLSVKDKFFTYHPPHYRLEGEITDMGSYLSIRWEYQLWSYWLERLGAIPLYSYVFDPDFYKESDSFQSIIEDGFSDVTIFRSELEKHPELLNSRICILSDLDEEVKLNETQKNEVLPEMLNKMKNTLRKLNVKYLLNQKGELLEIL